MKKLFTFFAALIIGAITVNATVYSFGGVTSDKVTVNSYAALSTDAISDTAVCQYNYTGVLMTSVMTLDINTLPNIELQYANTATKANFIKFYPNVVYTGGKNVAIIISTVKVGDSIIIHTTAKGASACTWTVTNGTTSSTLTGIDNTKWYDLRFKATATTVTLKETGNGFKLSTINWFSPPPSTGINNATVDNGAIVKTEYFNVVGGFLGADANALPNGIYIKKLTYENGAIVSSKTILRK